MLSVDNKKLYDCAREYAIANVEPVIAECDRNPEKIQELFDKTVKDGFCGIDLPKKVGGKGYSYLETAVVYEGLAHGSAEFAFLIQLQNNITLLIDRLSEDEHIKDIVKRMVKGELIAGYALTESSSGSDPASTTSYAELKEDGYHINGIKDWIANATNADYFTLMVKDGSPKGMYMLLVDKNLPGIKFDDCKEIMGGKLLGMGRIHFNDCIVPKNMLLTKRGYQEALASIDVARIFVPAICVGLSQRALDLTVDYLGNRDSMGKKIIMSEGVQWKLAELTAKVQAARQLVYHTAELMDSGEAISFIAAQNKLFAPQVAMEVTTQCLQYMGAKGCLEDNPINRYFKMAKVFNIVDGSGEIQRLIIGRTLSKPYFKR